MGDIQSQISYNGTILLKVANGLATIMVCNEMTPFFFFQNQKQMVQHPSPHWWSKLWNDVLCQFWILVL
jgi:hypothetical protein